MSLSLSILSVAIAISILIAVDYLGDLIDSKIEQIEIINDAKQLSHVTHLMPWILAQIAKSTAVVVDDYLIKVKTGKFPKEITREQYMQIIVDIRAHFYGTIPKSLSTNIHKYIDSKQIDLLILAQFGKANSEGDFKIK